MNLTNYFLKLDHHLRLSKVKFINNTIIKLIILLLYKYINVI